MSLTNLSLNRSLIEDAIRSYPEYIGHTTKPVNPGLFNFIVSVKGHPNAAMLNVIHLKDGETTLKSTVGKNQELSLQIAEFIASKCARKEIVSKKLYIKEMSDVEFESFLEFLWAEDDLEVSEKKDIANGQQYTIKHSEGGSVFINRFSNKAFSIQGKSNVIKEKIVEILTQVLPFKDVIAAQLESLDINITTDQVLAETQNAIPTAYGELSETLITLISPSIALRSVNIEMTDYSVLAFPVLKGIEGVLRVSLSNFGINVEENVGSVFEKLDNGSFQLPLAHQSKIHDAGTLRLINELYNMYYTERHTTFHTRVNVDTSRVIEDREEAIEIIDRGLAKIEELYIRIKHASV